eukprot:symbB.v1.2.002758.t1/scaffold141.1/size300911/9
MDTNSYDPPYQVMAKEEMMELTRKAVRKMVMKPADTPQRSPQAAQSCNHDECATNTTCLTVPFKMVPVQPTASWGMQGK